MVSEQNKLDSHFLHECIQEAVQVKLQEDTTEQDEIKRRKNNVVLQCCLREPESDNAEGRKEIDETQILELLLR